MTRVAILNSRQSKTPVGTDPWVRATLEAVAHVAANDWTIVSSIGLNTWELVTWAAGQHNAELLLILPDDFSETAWIDLLRRFDLPGDRVEWVRVPRGDGHSNAKNWWEHRDAEIIARADILIPVSVRPKGRIETLLSTSGARATEGRYRVPYKRSSHHAPATVDSTKVHPGLQDWSREYLIHWTRACHGPWPGETESQFYSALSASHDSYCHSALRTLARIIDERLIRASSWKIGANTPVVAFTGLSPVESLSLMRWRPRWSRWSFEPYGVAVERSAAMALGARPVRYLNESEWKSLSQSEKSMAHRVGQKADVWPAEREWRMAGDVDLSRIADDAIRIIVRRTSEAPVITSLPVDRSFFIEND